MTDPVSAQARTALVTIVDDLIAQHPDEVARFGRMFPAGEGAGAWLVYGLERRA